MAELLEVPVLRMENYEQQQKEVSQLRTQVTKLQRCCQLYGAETEVTAAAGFREGNPDAAPG